MGLESRPSSWAPQRTEIAEGWSRLHCRVQRSRLRGGDKTSLPGKGDKKVNNPVANWGICFFPDYGHDTNAKPEERA